MREKNLNPTAFVLHSHLYKPQQSALADTQGRKKMFWYIVGFFAIIVSLLALWVNASAFGMQDDGTPQSEYEKMLGLGAKLKDKDTVAKEREAARFHPDD